MYIYSTITTQCLYISHQVDTETLNHDVVAGIRCRIMDCKRFPFSIGWFSVFGRELISDFKWQGYSIAWMEFMWHITHTTLTTRQLPVMRWQESVCNVWIAVIFRFPSADFQFSAGSSSVILSGKDTKWHDGNACYITPVQRWYRDI